ncbi:MAG: hypothetical protein EPO40_02960 [Myxococcaceae bacterium]|nr:MAG: hypothetical protein EPO40_02960 [Myxococcaceae bacterium]
MTTDQATASNATPTGELPLVPSPTPRAAVQAAAAEAPDNIIERIKHRQALVAADTIEQYCSTRKAPRHRLGERTNETHSIVYAPVGAPRDERRAGIPSLLLNLIGARS